MTAVVPVSDVGHLAQLGYKAELKRNFSTLHVFGIGFSIMSLMPSVASCLTFSLAAGPVGMTWGWLVPGIFILTIGIAMSELGSAFPTSGGLYWWTYKFSNEKLKKPLSWLAGYSSTMGMVGALCSTDYGFATFVTSILTMMDNSYDPSQYHLYIVFALTVVSHIIAACYANEIMNHLTTFSIVTNLTAIIITVIALPIGTLSQRPLNPPSFVFGNVQNLTEWPASWNWFLGWQTCIWTVGSYDSMVHIAEEVNNAATAIPFGIITSIISCVLLGFALMSVLAACMNPNFQEFADSPMNPIAQIYYDSLGKNWAIAMMLFLVFIQWFMGLSLMVAGSRQSWAFSRDGALPFSSYLKAIDKTLGIPVRTILFCGITCMVIGSVSLLNETAGASLFSMSIAANYMAYSLPIVSRTINFESSLFKPGPFYLGHFWSYVNSVVASLFLLFVLFVIAMCPHDGPHPNLENMNYTFLVSSIVWFGAMAYYWKSGYKWFKGPTMTIDNDEAASLLAGNEASYS